MIFIFISINEYLENCENCITKAQVTHTLLCPFTSEHLGTIFISSSDIAILPIFSKHERVFKINVAFFNPSEYNDFKSFWSYF